MVTFEAMGSKHARKDIIVVCYLRLDGSGQDEQGTAQQQQAGEGSLQAIEPWEWVCAFHHDLLSSLGKRCAICVKRIEALHLSPQMPNEPTGVATVATGFIPLEGVV
jgi:hypothetical protein